MLPFVLAAVGGYLIGNSIASKEKYADGGMMEGENKYEVELFFKGLERGDREIGKYVITQKTLDILENEWRYGIDSFYPALSIDVIDESNAKPITYNQLRDKIYTKKKTYLNKQKQKKLDTWLKSL
jgi:hypothetical protein